MSRICARQPGTSRWMMATGTQGRVPARSRSSTGIWASCAIAALRIEELAEKSTFVETAYLVIYGNLPTSPQLRAFSDLLTEHQFLHEDMKFHFEGFPTGAHPMAILSAMINAASCFDEKIMRWQWSKTVQFDVECGEADLAGAHDRRLFVSQIPRVAAHLSQEGVQIHGQFPAHDVLHAVRGL